MTRLPGLLLGLCALSACPSRASSPPPDARAPGPTALSATHVCFGPGGSAVEVPRATPCATLGGSDTPPMEVIAGRRDGGTPRPTQR